MNKRITLEASHGDRLNIVIGKEKVIFSSYSDGNGFAVSILKEELIKLLCEVKK